MGIDFEHTFLCRHTLALSPSSENIRLEIVRLTHVAQFSSWKKLRVVTTNFIGVSLVLVPVNPMRSY